MQGASSSSQITPSSQEASIRQAAREGRVDEIQALAINRTLLNSRDPKGMTPLHHAVKRGHLTTIVALIESGAHLGLADFRGRTSLDLSLKSGSDLALWPLLFGKLPLSYTSFSSFSCSSSSSQAKSRERLADEELAAAFQRGDLEGEIVALVKRALFFLEGRDWWRAALTLNSAHVVAQAPRIPDRCRTILSNQLEQMESNLFRQEMAPTSSSRTPQSYRSRLQEIRRDAAHALQSQAPAAQILFQLTNGFKELLRQILRDSIKGQSEPPPTRFAMIGLGSMSRTEMAPYSDAEFFFLIEEDKEENRAYFRSIARLMALKIANLGETEFKLVQTQSSEKSLAPKGFSVDIAGLSPLGKEGLYELIGAPEEIAYLQTEEWFRQNEAEIILVNALTTSCLVEGEASLIGAYQREVDRILNQETGTTLPQRLREARALELMQGYLQEFEPKLDQDKVDLHAFDIKKELYRLLQSVISALALYYDLKNNNSFDRIEELRGRRILSRAGAGRLKNVFDLIFRLRIEAHLFYQTESEILYYSREHGEENSEDLLPISEETRLHLNEIYRTLIPFYHATQAFIGGDLQAFSSSPLYNESIGTHHDLREQIEGLDYEAALKKATSTTALNPDSSSHLIQGLMQLELSEGRDALKNLLETLAILRDRHKNRPHREIARTLNFLGVASLRLADYSKAIDYHQQSLAIYQRLCGGRPDPDFASCLASLGNVYGSAGQYENSLQLHQDGLAMRRALYSGLPHPEIADSLSSIGNICGSTGQYAASIEYHQEALAIRQQGKPSSDLAASLSNLGCAYDCSGNYQAAIHYHLLAIAAYRELYKSRPHAHIAGSLNNLGSAYDLLEEYDLAIQYHSEALAMREELYPDQFHPEICISLSNLGQAFMKAGKYDRAVDCFERALSLERKEHGDFDLGTATTLTQLGIVYFGKGELSRAQATLLQAQSTLFQLAGPDHPLTLKVTAILSQMGPMVQLLTLSSDGGSSSLEAATRLAALGDTLQNEGDFEKAIEAYNESHSLFTEALGAEDPKSKSVEEKLGFLVQALTGV